jgi:hypothetical protein
MPRHRRSRSSRVRLLTGAEPLESRSLLTSLAASPVQMPAGEEITIQVPSPYVSERARMLDVTLVRQVDPGAGSNSAAQAQALLAQPLTVELSLATMQVTSSTSPIASTGASSPRASLAAAQQSTAETLPLSAGPEPVQQAVTFPAGVATVTVPVPLTYSTSPAGNVEIALHLQDLGSQVYAGDQQLYILNGADAIPPAITNVHMLMSGGKVTGISMTFSKAMNPASVQDLHSYLLTPNNSVSMSRLRTFLATGSLGSNPDRPIPLKAAKYDPSTDTVVLTPRKPLSSTTTYQIGAGRSVAMTNNPNRSGPLLDLQGNAITEGSGGIGGAFSITVSANLPYSAPAPVLWGGN